MNLHGKKWLSLVVEDGMILTTHTQKQISVNRTPTVFNSKHIRIICLFERYGFSSQYEQLMRWETWSSLRGRDTYSTRCLHRTTSEHFITQKRKKKQEHGRVSKGVMYGMYGKCEVISNTKGWREVVCEIY